MNRIVGGPHSPEAAELRDFATSVLGSDATFEDVSRVAGRQSTVWRITTKHDEVYFLKSHERQQLYEREVRALEEWAPLLPRPGWWSIGELVSKSEDIPAVIVTAVAGDTLDTAPVTDGERREMFALAGRFASILHSLPIEDDGDEEYAWTYLKRAEHLIGLAEPYLDRGTVEWARSVISKGEAFAGTERVATHHDYSPRNWLIDRGDDGIRFGLIDWERARMDHWLQDAQRIAHDHWQTDPQLREAFFEGYGRAPTEAEERQLDLLTLLNTIGAVPWAIERNDAGFERLSRRIIERLKKLL